MGIWALNQGVLVKSFKVVELATASPLPATPPIKAFNLGAKNAPRSFQWFGGHYWTNPELSRANHVATLHGFRLGYVTNYGDLSVPAAGPYYLSSFVYADATPQVAQGYNAQNLAGDRQQNVKQPG